MNSNFEFSKIFSDPCWIIQNSWNVQNLNRKSKVVGQFWFGCYLWKTKFTSPTRCTLKINKKVVLRFEKFAIRDFAMSSIIRCWATTLFLFFTNYWWHAKSRIAIFSNLSDNFLFIFSARLVGFVNFVFRKYKGNRYWPTNLDFPFKFHILNFWSMSIFWNTPTRISKIQNYANLKSIPFFIWWSVRVNFSSMSEIRSNTAVLHSLRGSHDSS